MLSARCCVSGGVDRGSYETVELNIAMLRIQVAMYPCTSGLGPPWVSCAVLHWSCDMPWTNQGRYLGIQAVKCIEARRKTAESMRQGLNVREAHSSSRTFHSLTCSPKASSSRSDGHF